MLQLQFPGAGAAVKNSTVTSEVQYSLPYNQFYFLFFSCFKTWIILITTLLLSSFLWEKNNIYFFIILIRGLGS